MRKTTFRPCLDHGILEARVALSHIGAVPAHSHPKAAPAHVVRIGTINSVTSKIDNAFSTFDREYTREINTLNRTHGEATFQSQFDRSVAKLRTALARQAARMPGGTQNLAPELQSRVDSLVKDLETNSSQSSKDLITSDEFGAKHDVNSYVHDATSRGDFSVR
jgi:hypothetical protein